MGDLALLVLGGIALAYAAVAAFAIFVLQAFVPRHRRKARVLVILALAAIALVLPPLYLARGEGARAVQAQAVVEQVTASCRDAQVEVNRPVTGSAWFMDLRYLDMLLPRNGDLVRFDQVVNFMLRQRLETLEVPWRQNLLTTVPVEVPAGHPVVRLRLQRRPDAGCATMDEWLGATHRQGELRRAGLAADACVALDFLAAPQAPHRLEVSELLLSSDSSSWRRRYEIMLRDVRQPGQPPAARLVELHARGGGGNAGYAYSFPCGAAQAGERLARFGAAIRSPGTPLALAPAEVDLLSVAPLAAAIDDAAVAAYRWVVPPGRSWPVSPDGLAWVENNHVLDGVRPLGAGMEQSDSVLVALVDGALLRRTVRWQGARGVEVSGLAVAGDRLAVLAYPRRPPDRAELTLFSFDRKSRQASAARLSAGQAEVLLGPTPARK